MTNHFLAIALLLGATILSPANLRHRELVAKTGSMLPTIPINASLIVDESFYATRDPQRFDIVVVRRSFSNPDSSQGNMDVIVRVIGLPGETIALRKGDLYINGRKIKEPFAIKRCPVKIDEGFPCGEMSAMKIPVGEYFLLADNRPESEDSRLWSPRTISKSDVLGKVVKVAMPITAVQRALGADSPVKWPLFVVASASRSSATLDR
jgi:signal peptidase I